ncbi:MAG TPA: NAD(P)-binding domain-containing protein [Pseudolysinimonas sp.]|jgi:3-hydroxyisobutyrate dehydrogenase-like beta-hydroxyacid dehydrogenase
MAPGGALVTRIGVLGTGRMGLPIARNLKTAGFEVFAYDSEWAKEAPLRDAGIVTVPTADALAAAVQVLLTVLPDGEAVHAARVSILALHEGALWIDLSSGDPRLSEPDQREARSRGIRTVSAPVSGGPAEAAAGDLGFFVSGRRSDVRDALMVLRRLGPAAKTTIVGSRPGDAQIVKLLANLLWFGQVIAATEALLLGARLGLDVAVLRDALAASAGGSAFLDRHVDRLLAGDYLEDFPLDRCVDELRTITELARDAGTPFELGVLVRRINEEALDRFGPLLGELLAARLLEERAGVTLRA